MLALVLLSVTIFSQTSIPKQSDYIAVDDFNKIYLVSGVELLKYNLDGKLISRYSNAVNGNISSIDVSDPLRILLFYKESNTIQYLNKQLSPISDAIELYDLSPNEPTLACNFNQGGFWIYDPLTQTLSNYNRQRQKIYQSENIAAWLNEATPVALYAFNNQVQLQLSNNQILVFDAFGNYMKRHFVSIKNSFQIKGKLWYYFTGEHLMQYNPLNKTEVRLEVVLSDNSQSALLCTPYIIEQLPNSISIKSHGSK